MSLSKATDSLDRRLKLGDAVGGLILLAIAGTLPEIAIVASAAAAGHLDLAVGNLIGGIAIQTLVLVALDAATGLKRPLSFLVGSLIPVLEALIVDRLPRDRARRRRAARLDEPRRRQPDLDRRRRPLARRPRGS